MKKQNLKNRILAAAACVVLLISTLVLPIGAEDAQPTWEIDQPENTLAWLDYPGANLIKFPYTNSNKTENGLTFNINENGEIHITGTSTSNTYWYLQNNITLETNQTYTLTGCPAGGGSTIYSLTYSEPNTSPQKWNPDYGQGCTFQSKYDSGLIYIFIASGQTVDLIFKPMLTKGNVAYPFMPYLPYVMDQYYQQGSTDGEATGYENGFQEGEQSAYENITNLQQNIFDTATYESATTFSTDPEQHMFRQNIIPNKTEGGVYFTELKNQIIASKGEEFCQNYMEETFLTLKWNNDKIWNWSQYPISIQGDSMVQSATLTTESGKKYTLSAEGNSKDLRQFVIQEQNVEYPIYVKEIRIRVGRSYDLLSAFTILSSSKEYNLGFTNGYASGASASGEAQYNIGFSKGKQEGLLLGKQEGLELAKTGDWTNLFTAVVEAPINTFQSLFNFEILGLDMRAAFGSILAVCVLLIIVKKVIL